MPLNLVAVCKHSGGDRSTVVTAQSHKHKTRARNRTRRAELKFLLEWLRNELFLTIGATRSLDVRVLVLVSGMNELGRVRQTIRSNLNALLILMTDSCRIHGRD